MTRFHTIASGSSGNAALFSDGGVHILIDMGISCRRIVAALAQLGLRPDELSAILITHEHTDHIAGLQVLTKKLRRPILSSAPTCRLLDQPYNENCQLYVIDGFILSPNVELREIKTVDLGFEYSDHNPVRIAVTLG